MTERCHTRTRWTPALEDKATQLRVLGWTFAAIGEELGVSATLVRTHMGLAAQRSKSNGRGGKFRVGDRVVYHPRVFGNTDIDGWEGVVIFVDSTHCPYTVRFDEAWIGGMTEQRVGHIARNSMRCWFCREENLSLVGAMWPQKSKNTTA